MNASMSSMPAPTAIPFRREEALAVEEQPVSPTREDRANDASKLTVPIAWVWVIVIAISGFAVNQAWTLNAVSSKIDRMEGLLAASEKHNKEIQKVLEEKIELQIQLAGLRTTAMQLADRIEQLQADSPRRK